MNSDTGSSGSSPVSISYDGPPLVEVEIEGVEYRLDAGKQGTALCVSTRTPGSYDWQFLSEARWDGRDMRVKVLDRPIVQELARALRAAVESGE
jgi:hypothetical protein